MNTNIYILCINQNNYILEHNMIKYIILILILICYSFIIYFKITHRFWSRQPVFHFHNLLYWLKPPGIISTSLPSFTSKFYSEQALLYNYMNLSKKQKRDMFQLIHNNFLYEKDLQYKPTPTSIFSYFENQPCYISLFYQFNSKLLQTSPCVI